MKRRTASALSAIGLILPLLTVQVDIVGINSWDDVPLPNVASQPEQVSAGDWVPYGTTYVWSTDFSDLAGLQARLQYVHGLGVHTVI